MKYRKYEPRFKVLVPIFPPKYLDKAFNCYSEKMKREKKIGFLCEEMSKRTCALHWLCHYFACLTLDARTIKPKKGGL